MLTINSVFILRKCVNHSVNLFSNRNMNSAVMSLNVATPRWCLNVDSRSSERWTAKRRAPGNGLRQFAMSVLLTVEKKGRTSYNEVADELVREVSHDSTGRVRAVQVCHSPHCTSCYAAEPSGYWSTAPHAVVLTLIREHYYCVDLYMPCRLMYWRMLLIYTKLLPVRWLWVHDV